MKTDIKNLIIEELIQLMAAMGEPAHRAHQAFLWLNNKGIEDFSAMTNLPKKLVEELKTKFSIGTLTCAKRLKSKDGTEKFLWQLKDKEYIETVLIKDKKRRTLCLSTQAGCKFKCSFCASGTKGLVRNLETSEIVNQVHAVQKLTGQRITNIVFMGMGEPLDNYESLVRAIQIINHPKGIGIGGRKITVSTCGIIPGILKLKDLEVQIELSISLHAANDKLRNELVPINRKYSLGKLMSVCKTYCGKTGRIITLEYTLIKGKNDLLKDADDLAAIAKTLRAKVNLISCSSYPGGAFEPPDMKQIKLFKDRLCAKGTTVIIRKSKGSDILAACGQLAAKT